MLSLYNTLTRCEEPFEPSRDGTVRMYTCGPTVYDFAHIGNFRTFLAVDILRRYLRTSGYRVVQVMNLTDVDDRTIAGASRAGLPLREYTDRFVRAFFEDADTLGIEPAEHYPRATDERSLAAMADIVRQLEARGHAYRSDGSVYFKIASFPAYGRLARLDPQGIQAGARVEADNYSKEDIRDFVLWKAQKPGEPSWDFGFGRGRPGWHLECSAMALSLLGPPPIDLHGGGVDLVFPHHENEIAQSEAATGTPFARFWFHAEHLVVDGQTMSKSRGNFFTIRDLLTRGTRPSSVRYLLTSVHYRKPLNFTWTGVGQADEALRRLADFAVRVRAAGLQSRAPSAGGRGAPASTGRGADGDGRDELRRAVEHARAEFRAAMDADLNTSGALAAIFGLVRIGNAALDAGAVSGAACAAIAGMLDEFDAVFGVLRLRAAEDARSPSDAEAIEQRIAEREAARARKDYATADRIRAALAEDGVILEDTPAGVQWKRK